MGAACEYLLHNTGYDIQRVSPCRWENPTLKSVKELEKLFEGMGLVIVGKINFLLSLHFTVANVTVWCIVNIVSEIAFIQNKQQEEEASSG